VIRVGVLTLSDKGSRGEREDASGPAIRELMETIGSDVVRYEMIADDFHKIITILKDWADDESVDLILTTGGTGLAPRDVTPEATLAVVDREAPGIAELMRAEGLRHTPMAALSRAVAGARGRTLIVNLPGSEKGVRESLSAILPVLPHAVELVSGRSSEH
jgi:molybdopterin adenylyltransferase